MKSKGKKKGYIGIAITAILLIVTVVADLLVSRYITMIKLYFRDDSNSVYVSRRGIVAGRRLHRGTWR